MKKRILPALLALCMVMSLLPVSVFAEEPQTPAETCGCPGYTGCNHQGTAGNDGQKACNVTENLTDVDGTKLCATCKTNKENASKNPENPPAAKETCSECGCELGEGAGKCTKDACAHKVKLENEQDRPQGCLYIVCTATNCVSYNAEKPLVEKNHKHYCADCGCEIKDGSCAVDKCKHNGDEQGETAPATCAKYEVCSMSNCIKLGTVHAKAQHTIGTTCKAEGATAAYKANCTQCTLGADATHDATCPKSCQVLEGCTLGDGHKADHTVTDTCSKDDRCALTGQDATHDNLCPKKPVQVTEGTTDNTTHHVTGAKVKAYFTQKMTAYVPCTCDKNHVDGVHKDQAQGQQAVACPNKEADQTTKKGAKASLTVTVEKEITFEYDEVWSTGENPEKDTNKTNAAKEAAAKKAKADAEKAGAAAAGVTEAEWNTALTSARTTYLQGQNLTDLCDDCKAQLGLSICTKGADCIAEKHEDDCLKLCTHSASCKNTKGNAAVHIVKYKVMAGSTEKGNYDTYEAAVAARKALIAADENGKYAIVTDPCPMAQVNESVVVGPDEEAPAEDPTVKPDEPKAPEKAEDFSDLKGDEWYAEDLTALMSKGIIKGSLDAGKYSFGATDKLTTSHLVVFLSRVLDKGLVTEGKDWDKAATAWATEDGLTEGVEAGEITRKDVVLVLWRAAGKPESTQSLEALTDVDGLTEDETAALRWAVETKVITGYEDNTFKPADSITRAEMVAVLSRFDKAIAK